MTLKKYKCIKKVFAAQILEKTEFFEENDVLKCYLYFSETEFVSVTEEWMNRHKPKIGGYFVQYEDGYNSYSPKEAFENGYVLED